MEKKDLSIITNSLVTSRLDYYNALFLCVGLPLESVLNLPVQNSVAWMLMGASKFLHITPGVALSPDTFPGTSQGFDINIKSSIQFGIKVELQHHFCVPQACA